jgi:hypothetical protein
MWMSRPKDARAMVRAMIEAAERRRLAAEPLPDLPLFQEQLLDERIKVGRHAEDWAGWLDWTTATRTRRRWRLAPVS